jgi:hypothetical protein
VGSTPLDLFEVEQATSKIATTAPSFTG